MHTSLKKLFLAGLILAAVLTSLAALPFPAQGTAPAPSASASVQAATPTAPAAAFGITGEVRRLATCATTLAVAFGAFAFLLIILRAWNVRLRRRE